MKQVKMISKCIDYLMSQRKKSTLEQAMMRLIGFISFRVGVVCACTKVMSQNEYRFMVENMHIDLLKEDKVDYLTLYLEQKGYVEPVEQGRVDQIVNDLKSYRATYTDPAMLSLIVPNQTSRLMVEAFKEIGIDAVYACVEPDLLQYRIALANAAIHGIPALILNADNDIHRVDTNSSNWDYANLWEGAPRNKLEVL